jgi:hypothetical protein
LFHAQKITTHHVGSNVSAAILVGARRDPGLANETNNATVTGLITLAKGCFMFHGPVRVVDHEYRASKTSTRVTLQA